MNIRILALLLAGGLGFGCSSGDCEAPYNNLCGSDVCEQLRACCKVSQNAMNRCTDVDDDIDTARAANPAAVTRDTIDDLCRLTKIELDCAS